MSAVIRQENGTRDRIQVSPVSPRRVDPSGYASHTSRLMERPTTSIIIE